MDPSWCSSGLFFGARPPKAFFDSQLSYSLVSFHLHRRTDQLWVVIWALHSRQVENLIRQSPLTILHRSQVYLIQKKRHISSLRTSGDDLHAVRSIHGGKCWLNIYSFNNLLWDVSARTLMFSFDNFAKIIYKFIYLYIMKHAYWSQTRMCLICFLFQLWFPIDNNFTRYL